ncbi:hypothetical protein GPECTOR_17g807 [Gonium pectorale]|uniref:Uncharacterized protein n=1 Tax=Gonium pectorale TaxID=33097 RepID=A0A150GK66_GONPE|nr:hypothetical protein GPECTOR_17g807 [Gonium pectorale]|eukprot:KXZ50171.1 hypothetical protein GPECTOR_17g807 [Gonium pectorale]
MGGNRSWDMGAYLALPAASFSGSAPFRSLPHTEGLAFERYTRRQAAEDLPEVQLRYIRPPGTVAPREPRMLVLQQHFRSSAAQQTQQLRSQLNANRALGHGTGRLDEAVAPASQLPTRLLPVPSPGIPM